MSETRQAAYRRGVLAEAVAALYFMARGYRILKLRYKTPMGEIDMVAAKRDMLVMVEVKLRAALDDALISVSPRSQMRIEKAARHFISRYPEFANHAVRFDLVAFGKGFRFKHLDNAWSARA